MEGLLREPGGPAPACMENLAQTQGDSSTPTYHGCVSTSGGNSVLSWAWREMNDVSFKYANFPTLLG